MSQTYYKCHNSKSIYVKSHKNANSLETFAIDATIDQLLLLLKTIPPLLITKLLQVLLGCFEVEWCYVNARVQGEAAVKQSGTATTNGIRCDWWIFPQNFQTILTFSFTYFILILLHSVFKICLCNS